LQKKKGKIKDLLNIRTETIKLLENSKKVPNIGQGRNILNITLKVQARKAKPNKWYCIKLKSFCTAKEIIHRVKRQLTG
jgi:hypothetical protein